MCHLGRHILKREEVVWHLWRSRHFTGTLEAKHKKVEYETVILHDERCKLQAADDAVRVGVVHVLHTAKTSRIIL